MKSPLAQREVGVPALIAGVLVVALLLAWLFTIFVGRPSWLGMTDNQYIAKMAAETNGDFSKLSQADQDRINRLTKGQGAKVFGFISHKAPAGAAGAGGGARPGGPGRP